VFPPDLGSIFFQRTLKVIRISG